MTVQEKHDSYSMLAHDLLCLARAQTSPTFKPTPHADLETIEISHEKLSSSSSPPIDF
jgi:hypothetical protein